MKDKIQVDERSPPRAARVYRQVAQGRPRCRVKAATKAWKELAERTLCPKILQQMGPGTASDAKGQRDYSLAEKMEDGAR